MRTNRTVIGVVASVILAGLVIAGLLAIGSPGTARKFRSDQRRVERLHELHQALLNHFADQGELPESLNALDPAFWENYGIPNDPRRDPVTGELLEYRTASSREYQVCAVFETSSDDPRNPTQRFRDIRPPLEPGGFEGFYAYEQGRNCFDRRITNTEARNLYPPSRPLPREAIVQEPPTLRVP